MKKFFILLMVVLMLAGLAFGSFAEDKVRDRDCDDFIEHEIGRQGIGWPAE